MPHKMAIFLYEFWGDTKSPCSKLLKSKGYLEGFALQTSNSPKIIPEQITSFTNSSPPCHWVIGMLPLPHSHVRVIQACTIVSLIIFSNKAAWKGSWRQVASSTKWETNPRWPRVGFFLTAPERHFGAGSMIRTAQLSRFLVRLREKTSDTHGALTTIKFGNPRSLAPHIDEKNGLQNQGAPINLPYHTVHRSI